MAAIFPLAFFGSAKVALGRLTPPPPWFVTPLDEFRPVAPCSVWFYLSWYLLPTLVFTDNRQKLRVGVLAMFLSLAACVVGFLSMPITIVRPVIASENHQLALRTLRALYQLDPPMNLFPSLHAAVAVVIGRVVISRRAWMTLALRAWCGAICCSCVLTGQHYVLDVVTGCIVGFAAVQVARVLVMSDARAVVARIVPQAPAEKEA